MSEPPEDTIAVRSVVRRNVIWAVGAAALMLYYGIGKSIPDDVVGAQKQGWIIFLYTLKIGGGAMLLSVLLSLAGVPLALMYDSVLSIAIGLALGVSGVLVYSCNSRQAIFNILFTVIFVHSGYRNWREFRLLTPLEIWDEEAESGDQAADHIAAEREERG